MTTVRAVEAKIRRCQIPAVGMPFPEPLAHGFFSKQGLALKFPPWQYSLGVRQAARRKGASAERQAALDRVMAFSGQHGQGASQAAFQAAFRGAFQGRTSGEGLQGKDIRGRTHSGKQTKDAGRDGPIVVTLRNNARISMRELGRLVHLSGQAAKNRVERLEEAGVLRRFTINVDTPVCLEDQRLAVFRDKHPFQPPPGKTCLQLLTSEAGVRNDTHVTCDYARVGRRKGDPFDVRVIHDEPAVSTSSASQALSTTTSGFSSTSVLSTSSQ